jgi:SNF2 family DNA or RNA helicase
MLVPKTRTMKSGKVVNSGFDIEQFNRVGIKCVILDECQQIKNVDSTRTQMVRRVVKGRKVIPLSGTPWNNRGSELFPVFNMMDPMKFHSEERFKYDWVDYYWQGNFRKEGGIRKIPQFKEFTKDLCIRRERQEVLPELPLVNRTKLNVVMTPQEEGVYDEAVEAFVQWYEAQAEGLTGMAIIAAMAKMRHLVALAKIPTTLDYVEEFVEDTDRKLCIFAHHKDVQAILLEELTNKYGQKKLKDGKDNPDYIPVLSITADIDSYKRNQICDEFNMHKRVIMVASQLASGEGLNLQTCCDCVMHERQWNPGKEEQCEGRFIRIGSVATSVSAVYAHLEGLTTTDPKLDSIVERKRLQFHSLMNKGEAVRWSEDSIMKELAESIVKAHKAKKGKAA